jgi:hypothetical protein
MKAQFINFFIMDGYYTVVWTYEVAHSAAHAGVDRVSALVDTMVNAEQIARLLIQADIDLKGPLPVDT